MKRKQVTIEWDKRYECGMVTAVKNTVAFLPGNGITDVQQLADVMHIHKDIDFIVKEKK